MAGLGNTAQISLISALIDQWQVQYSRFINYSSVTCTRTHPSLSPVEKSRRSRGSWISTAAATLKLAYRRSPTGLCESVITISLQSQVLEEHYVSKMLFSWPQVSCVSGYPERGCKAIFVSYKDGVGQVQKFAMRFSTLNDSDKFMNFVKEIVKNESQQLLLSPIINSGQPKHKKEEMMIPSPIVNEAAQETSVFPPSFTQLMKNCHPAVSEAKTTSTEDDLKTQFMRYLEGTSFKELLATVANVVNVLEGDLVM
ncbi:hypothetical protein CASFOL_009678 [Castilleja foliolosa]|uniref:Poor homologous synapsis 1 PH domain-containing protein n=1 Tax=Castilleja foliolosa TaxID=1961234 RepID=A0ABD3DQC1_9LAMI